MFDSSRRGRRRRGSGAHRTAKSSRLKVWRSNQHNRPRPLVGRTRWAAQKRATNHQRIGSESQSKSRNHWRNRGNQNYQERQQGKVFGASGCGESQGHSFKFRGQSATGAEQSRWREVSHGIVDHAHPDHQRQHGADSKTIQDDAVTDATKQHSKLLKGDFRGMRCRIIGQQQQHEHATSNSKVASKRDASPTHKVSQIAHYIGQFHWRVRWRCGEEKTYEDHRERNCKAVHAATRFTRRLKRLARSRHNLLG